MIDVVNLTNKDEYVEDVRKVLEFGLNYMKAGNALLNVIIVDNSYIHNINKTYRDVDKVTDVISFAFEDNTNVLPEEVRVLGEIYISIDKAKEQAIEYGHSALREVTYLSIHGLLHLLGYDHMNEEDKKEMRKLEEEILSEYR